MNPNSEAANAIAVRCLCTATHMRTFLGNGNHMTEDVRHDLTVAADLLETVCSEIEQGSLLNSVSTERAVPTGHHGLDCLQG